ncbi:MAG: T9SS type A sorting domain-containing protein [Ignavibacteriae bacterium]|nr:T9SS type A sorting domain-containing protein [Ignavibacteriota bacterium]
MKKLILLVFLFLIINSLHSQVPNPPTLLLPPDNSNVNMDSVLLDWSDVPGALSYRVQVYMGVTTILDVSGILISQYLVPSSYLLPNTTYYWRVNVTTSGGTSSWSTFFHFTTGLGPPSAPVLIIPFNGQTGVSIHPTFDWNGVPGATAYILHVSKSALFDSLVVCDTTPLATVTLEYNTHYYWRMCAKNSGGVSPWSSVFNFYTIGQVPDPPVLLSPADSSTIPVIGQVFDWSEPVGAVSYRIQISTSPTFSSTVLNQVTGYASQYTVSSSIFTSNTVYYWRVNATNTSGTSGWSSVWRVITQAVLPLPPSIIYPCGQINVPLTLTLDWTDVPGATSYRIQFNPSGIFDTVVASSEVTIPAGRLTYYTVYFWRVAAINNSGQGSWSTLCNFRTITSSKIIQLSSEIPVEYKLFNNYPNPFNPNTNIRYTIPKMSSLHALSGDLVLLKIFDVTGKEVVTLVNEKQPPGVYEVTFNGSDLPSGIYFYRLQSGDFIDVKKMLMIK